MLKCLMLIHFLKIEHCSQSEYVWWVFCQSYIICIFLLICFDLLDWSIRCILTCLLCTKVTSKH
jgi:hypothetical protein